MAGIRDDATIPSVPGRQESVEAAGGITDELPLLLIIEDNPDVVRYLGACLEDRYRLAVAQNGRQGLEKALELVPGLVVSDVMMPEMDGLALTRALKTDLRSSHIPVVLLTAKADIDSKIAGLEHGADAYLAKPFEKKELLAQLQNLWEGRRQLQQHYLARAGIHSPDPVLPQSLSGQTTEDAFVQKIWSAVGIHLSDPGFDVEQLCRHIGMSQSNLTRKLKALTGYPAVKYIRFIRLSHAKTRLLETDDSIATIAYDTGFNDPNYFSKVFHEETGVSTRGYRENMGKV